MNFCHYPSPYDRLFLLQIPGGLRSQSSIVCGVVCTKNVTNKRMRQHILNPKILLLRASIEYQRVENKFSELEPQILQVPVNLYWDESESDIVSGWVYRKSNLMFTLSSNEDQRNRSLSRSLLFSVNKP